MSGRATEPRAGALVVRAWREPGDPGGPLRVRVVEVAAAPGGEDRTLATTTSPAAAAAAVADWLRARERAG